MTDNELTFVGPPCAAVLNCGTAKNAKPSE